jgi:hypothetical protein
MMVDIEKKKAELASIMSEFLVVCPRFIVSEKHWNFLYVRNEQAKRAFTVQNLVKTALELYSFGYTALLTPTAEEAAKAKQREAEQLRKQQAAEAQAAANTPEARAAKLQKQLDDELAVECEWVRKLEIPLPGENEFQRIIRVTGAKDARRKAKFPRPAPPATPHAQTLLNTKQELAMRKARADAQANARNTPPIQPHGGHAQMPFIHAEEARARSEAAKDDQK